MLPRVNGPGPRDTELPGYSGLGAPGRSELLTGWGSLSLFSPPSFCLASYSRSLLHASFTVVPGLSSGLVVIHLSCQCGKVATERTL